MSKKIISARKFKPEVTRMLLEPEQAVLSCCQKGQAAQDFGTGDRCCPAPSQVWCLSHTSGVST